MSKTFVITKATKTTLRGRFNTTGEYITLYLDWGSGKERGFEFQPDRIYAKPKTQEEKQHNEIIIKKAKKKLSLKDAELLSDKTQIQAKIANVDFMSFFHFIKKLPKKNGKPKRLTTIRAYEDAMKSICENVVDLNKVRLRDIDKVFVRDFRNKMLEAGYGHNTASVYYQWFTSFLTLAVKHDYMDSNPCDAVETISMDGTVVNYIFHEDLQKLKAAKCPCPILKRVGLFASQTGMRSGDLKAFKWKQIQTVDDMYRVVLKQQKTEKPYTIHFRQDIMDMLGEPGLPDDLVFEGFKNNGITNKNMVIWFLNAGITPRGAPEENFTMHDFRHTFAITLGLNGANLYEISQLLGHSNVSTTEKHYARILEQMKQKIVFNLPQL